MNRNELVESVVSKTELRKSEASKAVDAVFDAIIGALKSGDEVRLVGFGTFTVSERAASEGRNPRTGEKIQIAASRQAKFKPGKGLRDVLND
jgi:DNA-binding protein HU-beta